MTKHLENTMGLPYIILLFVVLGVVLQPLSELFKGLYDININESILLTDYIVIGGIGATLVNSSLLMGLSYIVVRKLNIKITGAVFAGILTIGGFAFFGKNVLNVGIIYLGVFLYATYKKLQLKSVIVVFLFATGISPISSVTMFGLGLPYYIGIPVGIIAGIFAGFILVELSQRAITFHRGYNLYNVGFASGIIAFAYFSIIRFLEIDYTPNLIYSDAHHLELTILLGVTSLLFIIVGVIISNDTVKEYKKILKLSGVAVTDFTRHTNTGVVFLNIGLVGLVSLLILLILGVSVNGPIVGGLMTIMGFGAFGKHIKNILPVMLGVILMTLLLGYDFSIGIVLAILFSTALAPITGDYGIVIGILAGMLHLPIVSSIGQIHGGVVLYSNGFAAGFTAFIITTTYSVLRRRVN